MPFCFRCLSQSIGPAFLCLLGNKYGYQPLPATIDKSEYEAILAHLVKNNKDTKLVTKFYKLDKNALKNEYSLQKIDLKDKLIWGEMANLQNQLRASIVECFPGRHDIVDKYFISVTEMEVRAGVFENPESRGQVTFVLRDLAGIESDTHKSRRLIDMDGDVIVESAQNKLKTLKTESIQKHIADDNVYKTDYGKASPAAVKEQIKRLCDEICTRLLHQVQEGFKKNNSIATDKTFSEVVHHLKMAKEKRRIFIGRKDVLTSIDKYLADVKTKSGKPLVLYGESGCGKTSVMAMAALKAKESTTSSIVITRFIGTTSLSSSIRDVLRSICAQISHVYDDVTQIPDTYKELENHFHKCLTLANEKKRLILVIDSLDQLSADDNGRKLGWLRLSENLSPLVKIILSTTPGNTLDILTKLVPKDNMVSVQSLSKTEGPMILKEMLQVTGRELTNVQNDLVLKHSQKCPLPLYLRLLADEASSWKSYDAVGEIAIGNDVRTMIELLFDRLERKYGETFIIYALGYITASKQGLSQTELEDILSCNDKVLDELFKYWTPPMRRVPPLLWARVRYDLGDYLVETGSEGVVVYRWYHRQFFEAATSRYLKSQEGTKGDLQHELHADIADYFDGKWVNGKQKDEQTKAEKASNTTLFNRGVASQPLVFSGNRTNKRRLNRRKLVELPYHLIQMSDWDRLKSLVFNLEYLEAKFEAGMGYVCFNEHLNAAKDSKDASLQKLAWFLGQNLSFLSREPEVIYQLVSQLPSSHPLSHALTEVRQNKATPTLLIKNADDVRQEKEVDPCVGTLQGHSAAVRSVIFSSQGRPTFCRIFISLTCTYVKR